MSPGLHASGSTDGATDVRASDSRASGVNVCKVKVLYCYGKCRKAL